MANNTLLSNSNVNPNQNQENPITLSLGLSHVSPPHHSVNNRLSQLGLSQRLSDLRKTARGIWIHAHPSFYTPAKTHSSWLGALGLADGPAQLSFSSESIGDYAAENLIRESKKIRSQLLQASSSSSPGTNDDGKRKAIDVFQAQLLLASPPPSVNDGIGIGIINNRITTHLPLHNTNANYDHFPFLKAMSNFSHQNLITSSNPIQYPSLTTIFNANLSSVGNFLQHNNNNNNNSPFTAENGVNVISDDEDEGDGRIRSLPYKKYGPYTCPRCNEVFLTSQSFAAHVGGSHYRYETKAQRKKRLLSRIRKRNLRLQMVNGHLTFVPVSSHQAQAQASGSTNTRFARAVAPAPTVKVEEDQNQVAPPPPPPGMEAHAHAHANGAKIKSEPNV